MSAPPVKYFFAISSRLAETRLYNGVGFREVRLVRGVSMGRRGREGEGGADDATSVRSPIEEYLEARQLTIGRTNFGGDLRNLG